MASMSGFRAIEDLGKDLRFLGLRHRIVLASVIGPQVLECRLEVGPAEALGIGQESVLLQN